MESRTIRGVVAVIACALTVCVARAAILQQTGQYALAQGKPQIVSRLSLINGRNGLQTLVLAQYAPHSTAPLTRYVLTEGEPLHIVIVRDDFQSFGHVHPQMAQNGVFRVPYLLERGHRYYAYVASQPVATPEQAFRFVLQTSAPPHRLTATIAAPSKNSVNVGPYIVSSVGRIPEHTKSWFGIHIVHNGRPWGGTVAYHNADMDAVLINVATLQFAQVDGFATQGICCDYQMRMPALPRGLYRMWLQFDDGKAVYTAPLTFAAR